jgi:2-dehydro-3-deoxyphosphogluconate aldolase/(4S)-4-hydroxy-2-oxoglutarate aldolase
VLRPRTPLEAAPQLERLSDLGLRHVEIAWQPGPHWSDQCGELVRRFPSLALGAASVCDGAGVHAAAAAGFRYAVSPVLERSLLEAAAALDLTLVPGVMTPSEVNQARRWGCAIVKLFPAATLGVAYWRRLRAPLGEPLPFCISAGGIRPEEVLSWLEAGVDAVALGSALGEDPALLGEVVRGLTPHG